MNNGGGHNIAGLTFFVIFIAMKPELIHEELYAIKDKWRSIGEGLKVPGERLDQFVGLTDPLLEVIVHWLAEVGDTPPSWDTVMVTLRDLGISEAELADKIHRLHCDHRQEEKEIDERKAQADSGTIIIATAT